MKREATSVLIHVAVGDKTYIMFDSGVRGAADIFKALALGAKFVFVGRLWVWGLSIMGEHGVSFLESCQSASSNTNQVRHVMKSLLSDFDILLNVAGFQNIEQIDHSALGMASSSMNMMVADSHPESHPKNYPLIAEKSKL